MKKDTQLQNLNNTIQGFTLAEVLITLGIIGVVAAITLPTLIQKQEQLSTIAKYKKLYSSLANAHNAAVAKYGEPQEWDIIAPQEVLERYGEFLKVNQKCYNKKGCISFGDFVALNNVPRFGEMNELKYSKVRLNGGFSLFSLGFKKGCEYDEPYTDVDGNQKIQHVTNDCGRIYGVINETKKGKKNFMGKDHFPFIITTKGLYPHGYQYNDDRVKSYCSKDKTFNPDGREQNTKGETCGTYIMRFNNADYLK